MSVEIQEDRNVVQEKKVYNKKCAHKSKIKILCSIRAFPNNFFLCIYGPYDKNNNSRLSWQFLSIKI